MKHLDRISALRWAWIAMSVCVGWLTAHLLQLQLWWEAVIFLVLLLAINTLHYALNFEAFKEGIDTMEKHWRAEGLIPSTFKTIGERDE